MDREDGVDERSLLAVAALALQPIMKNLRGALDRIMEFEDNYYKKWSGF